MVAGAPSGLRDAHLRVVRQIECVAVAVEDTSDNILQRITFYDVDSRPNEKRLTDEEKRLYRKEIQKDITFFKKSYQRADIHADIAGLDAEASAEMIQALLTRCRGIRTAAREEPRGWPRTS